MQHRRRALLHNSAHCEKMRRKQHGTIQGDASENILIISAVVILRHIIKAEKGEKEPVSIRLLRRHR